jgi:hypothetical protein
MTFVSNDLVDCRLLARHPAIWPKIGVLEDAPLLRALRRERTSPGLSFDRRVPPGRVRRFREVAP